MDKISQERRRKNMQAIKSKDTKPELLVRKIVTQLGYRYRLHRKDIPGKPDLAFIARKKAIFVHGCFWHRHLLESCKIARLPKSNTIYWEEKLSKNATRDAANLEKLNGLGWKYIIIWECELKNSSELTEKIEKFLKD